MAEVRNKLMLTGPVCLNNLRGRRSSVCLHPTRELAVCIYEADQGGATRRLRYRVSSVGNRTSWSEELLYGGGKYPSVALACIDTITIAIATHQSEVAKDCYCKIGIVDQENQIIKWQDTGKFRGVRPKICASDIGTVIIIYEETYSYEKIRYKIGKVNIQPQPKIIWNQDTNSRIPDLNGVEPDVAISKDTTVVMCRTGYNTLNVKVGKIHSNDEIEWAATSPLPSHGINPAISTNSQGDVVELHQTKTLRRLCQTTGYILPSRTIHWRKTSIHTTGEYPTISLDESGFILEMHKTNIGTKLFQSQGLLRNWQEQVQPGNPPVQQERQESAPLQPTGVSTPAQECVSQADSQTRVPDPSQAQVSDLPQAQVSDPAQAQAHVSDPSQAQVPDPSQAQAHVSDPSQAGVPDSSRVQADSSQAIQLQQQSRIIIVQSDLPGQIQVYKIMPVSRYSETNFSEDLI